MSLNDFICSSRGENQKHKIIASIVYMTNNFCCINCGKYEGVKKVIKTYEIRGNDRNLNNHFEVRVFDLLVTYCVDFPNLHFC